MISILWIRNAGCREAKFKVTSKQCKFLLSPALLFAKPVYNFCPPPTPATVLEGLIETPPSPPLISPSHSVSPSPPLISPSLLSPPPLG